MLARLPCEIVQHIFKHIHPKRVLKYKRTCQYLNQCLSDAYFAYLNLAPHMYNLSTIEWYTHSYFVHAIRFRKAPIPLPKALHHLSTNLRQLILTSHSVTEKSIFGGTEFPTTALCNLVNLQVLNLSRNAFTGQIPAHLFQQLTKLEELDLSRNAFNGPVPESVAFMRGLRVLNLDANAFCGEIPRQIGRLSVLRVLSLESNQLSGVIPMEIGELVRLEKLHLGDNLLEGAIPKEVGRLTELKSLSLWANKLSGPIPVEVYGLRALMFLNVSYNRFTGGIERSVGVMRNLRELDLSYNELDGQIPAELSQLRLRSLYLKGNTKLMIAQEVIMNPSFRLMLMLERDMKEKSRGKRKKKKKKVMFSLLAQRLFVGRPTALSFGVRSYSSDLLSAALKEAEQTQRAAAQQATASIHQKQHPSMNKQLTISTQSAAFRISPKKTNLVAKVCRRLEISDAIKQMQFSQKRAGSKLIHVLKLAQRRSRERETQLGMEEGVWTVAQCFVGKSMYLRRIKMHARGRMGVMHHPSSFVTVVLKREEEFSKAVAAARKNPLVFDTTQEQKDALELQQLVQIFKKNKLYVPFKEAKTRFLHPVWSPKSFKYVTSKKWLNPK
ncbi:hypothetical protein HDU80_008642 [Chytriomyces hyalinus]|nr:hypothetical protein HDU80_008642 [Chytriomyces hyalinus]